MKTADGYDKLRGGYYTPEKIADFICRWAIRSEAEEILEPSCGDGSFLCAAAKRRAELSHAAQPGERLQSEDAAQPGEGAQSEGAAQPGEGAQSEGVELSGGRTQSEAAAMPEARGISGPEHAQESEESRTAAAGSRHIHGSHILGIELDPAEAAKAAKRTPGAADVVQSDFFTYYYERIYRKKEFDVVVGNPPFIRYQNVNEAYRKKAFEMMTAEGFHPSRLTNMWLPFLVLGSLCLKEAGRIGMVIPAELFQVNYAAETRDFLTKYFDRLTVITFKRLVFEDIQQEVLLLLGERTSRTKGIQILELDGVEDLDTLGPEAFQSFEVKELDHSSEKWVKYYLTNEEIRLMRRLRQDTRLRDVNELFEINVGLVSGENDFFLLNEERVAQFGLGNSVKMIIGKTEQLKGVILTREDFSQLKSQGKKVYVFVPENRPVEEVPKEEQSYIRYGEEQGFHRGYKCRIRKRWYCIPQSWEPDAFILRQVNRYPRIVLNRAEALSTDTIHKLRFLDGVRPEEVAAAFLNSFTLALGEITGRSYGGGVLTFEPGEIRKLKIPMTGADRLDLEQIDRWIREDKIYETLDYTDQILLKEGLGLSDREIVLLRGIWEKLRDRRIYRKENRKNGNLSAKAKADGRQPLGRTEL